MVALTLARSFALTHTLSLVRYFILHFGLSSSGCCTDEIVKILVVVVIMMLMLTTLSSCGTIRMELTHTSDQHITLGIGVQPPLQIPVPLLHIAIERKVTVAVTVATTTTALNSQIEEEKVPRSIYGRKDLQKKNRETRCNEIDEICITHTSSLPLILKNAHSYDLTIKSRR